MENTKYITLSQENFRQEVLESRKPVLVDFWAEWCGPCRAIAPVIEGLAEEFGGRAVVAKLDVDAYPEVAGPYDVRGIPTLLFFQNGKVVDRIIGLAPRQDIAQKLEALLGESVSSR